MKKKLSELVKCLAQLIFDKKGSNIIAIDVRGISSITDFVLIADGNVNRHVIALAKEIEKTLKEKGEKPTHIEGMQNGDWVVLDYFELVIHLFVPEMRQKYQLDQLWPDDPASIDCQVRHLVSSTVLTWQFQSRCLGWFLDPSVSINAQVDIASRPQAGGVRVHPPPRAALLVGHP